MAKRPFNKYEYYEASVQTPEEHVMIYDQMFRHARGEKALILREDFCGTFLISCAWIQSDPKRKAIGIDLDPEPIAYGKKHGFKKLKPAEKKRLKLLRQDVRESTPSLKPDVVGVGNFSFNIFKEKADLKKYFKSVLASLSSRGIFVLELAGGPGFIRTCREQKTYKTKELGQFKYYWDQKKFDPIKAHGLYAIHFKTSKGEWHKDVFVYDWRVWTIPELKELMVESGFSKAQVYWEEPGPTGNGNGVYVPMNEGDNAYSWIAFVVGIK